MGKNGPTRRATFTTSSTRSSSSWQHGGGAGTQLDSVLCFLSKGSSANASACCRAALDLLVWRQKICMFLTSQISTDQGGIGKKQSTSAGNTVACISCMHSSHCRRSILDKRQLYEQLAHYIWQRFLYQYQVGCNTIVQF